MAALLFAVLERFVSQSCANKMITEGDFLDVPCLKLCLSKALGLAIVLGSVLGEIIVD